MSNTAETFLDRRDAGRRLAHALTKFAHSNPLVLALPRGGVPVAFEVAKALQAPLSLLVVRKIGAPGNKEYGLGAVVDGGEPQIILNEEAMRIVDPPAGYVEAEAQRQLQEMERRRRLYLNSQQPVPTKGRTVIIVDDGVATGGTVRAAMAALNRTGAARIVLALPVAPGDTLEELTHEADEVICLHVPKTFWAVGQHYADFTQTSDDEVVRLLGEAHAWAPASG